MSSYYALTKPPITGKWKRALWIDDYFGKHLYGVQFEGEERVFDPDEEDLLVKDL